MVGSPVSACQLIKQVKGDSNLGRSLSAKATVGPSQKDCPRRCTDLAAARMEADARGHTGHARLRCRSDVCVASIQRLVATTLECRFTNCKHAEEPGCAIRSAIAQGSLEPARLERWRKLSNEDLINTSSAAIQRARRGKAGKRK